MEIAQFQSTRPRQQQKNRDPLPTPTPQAPTPRTMEISPGSMCGYAEHQKHEMVFAEMTLCQRAVLSVVWICFSFPRLRLYSVLNVSRKKRRRMERRIEVLDLDSHPKSFKHSTGNSTSPKEHEGARTFYYRRTGCQV